jgi:hypothetical protein
MRGPGPPGRLPLDPIVAVRLWEPVSGPVPRHPVYQRFRQTRCLGAWPGYQREPKLPGARRAGVCHCLLAPGDVTDWTRPPWASKQWCATASVCKHATQSNPVSRPRPSHEPVAKLTRVPCFRGSLAWTSCLQNHRESVRNRQDQRISSSVGALRMLSRWGCTDAARAREPRKHGTEIYIITAPNQPTYRFSP